MTPTQSTTVLEHLAALRSYGLVVFVVILVGGAILGPGRVRPRAAHAVPPAASLQDAG